MKLCKRCNTEQGFDCFHKSSQTKDGVQAYCKTCRSIISKKYELSRVRNKNNSKLQWEKRKNDPEYHAKRREWIEKNSESLKKKNKEYREKMGVLLLTGRSNQRCKKKGVLGTLFVEDWKIVLELTNYMCIACEESPANSIDHVIPVSKGGTNTIDNIQPMCLKCQLKKGTRVVDFRNSEFVEGIKKNCSKSSMG